MSKTHLNVQIFREKVLLHFIRHRTFLISIFQELIEGFVCEYYTYDQRSRKQARTKFPVESLCRFSLHFNAIYEALLHADPITLIL